MVDHHVPKMCIVDNASFVFDDGLGVDASSDGSSCVDLRLDFCRYAGHVLEETIGSIFSDGGVGENINGTTSATAGAGSTRVDGTATGIHVAAKSVCRFG